MLPSPPLLDVEKTLEAESVISDLSVMPPSAFAPAAVLMAPAAATTAQPQAPAANTRRGVASTSGGSFPPPSLTTTTATAQPRKLDNQSEAEPDALDGELDDDELDDDADDDADANNDVATTDDARLTRAATVSGGGNAPSASGDGKAPQPHVIRRRNVGVPKFLRFLYQILEQEDRDVIAWSHKGTAFQIRQPDALAEHVLPRYFKHNKVSSFQRQLNYFGFKKWTKTQTTICTFSHPFFVRDDKDKMKLIKRKERIGPLGLACADAASIAPAAATAAGATDSKSSSTRKPRANEVVRPDGMGARELAMRRHSTGALALSASMMPPGAVAMLMNRKRAGTVDLEFEVQHGQQGLDVIKEAGPCMPSRAKRKSLPHVMLPPSLKDRKGNQLFAGDFSPMDMTRPFSAAPMPIAAGGYFGQRMVLDNNPKQDALSSAVLPVSSELMMMQQQPYNRQHSHPGAMSSSGHFHSSGGVKHENAIDMSDLSGPLQSVQSSTMPTPWVVAASNAFNPSLMPGCGSKDPNMVMMNPFKFDPSNNNNSSSSSLHQNGGGPQTAFDPIPIMDYTTNSAQLSASTALKMHQQQQHQHPAYFPPQQQQQQEPQQKDFIDMLLETAALNDQEPQGTGMPVAWSQHYQQQQQQQLHAQHHLQQQHQQHMGVSFGFMQQPMSHHQQQHHQQQQHQHQHQQMQLSATMNGLGGGQAQRF